MTTRFFYLRLLSFLAAVLCQTVYGGIPNVAGFTDEPFTVSLTAAEHAGQPAVLVRIVPAPDHYVYADSIRVRLPDEDRVLDLVNAPTPVRKPDPLTETVMAFFDQPVDLIYPLPGPALPHRVEVRYLGCNPLFCYPPASVLFDFPSGIPVVNDGPTDVESLPETAFQPWEAFEESARETGYLGVQAFHDFLDRGRDGGRPRLDRLRSAFDRGAIGLLLVLILLGGLALNLTPCVLPMIPVNLAIIGAGAHAGSRRRGLLLGLVYGLGITLAYGALGLAAVLFRAQFGTLNASWVFNLVIAVVFVLLSLAMFDVFLLDFSRLQPHGASSGRAHAGIWVAFGFGAVSALLAGACVAPVVISVLLLAGEVYGRSAVFGILLPFLLGAGMALPWPFAGAGMSFLPKPGRWMNRVKFVFGILILILALYYGHQAWTLAAQARDRTRAESGNIQTEIAALYTAAQRSLREEKPLVLDFWATWCRSCLAMDRTTLSDPDIRQRLEQDFVFHKVQAEQPTDPATRDLLQRFDVLGLPTFVILRPRSP